MPDSVDMAFSGDPRTSSELSFLADARFALRDVDAVGTGLNLLLQ